MPTDSREKTSIVVLDIDGTLTDSVGPHQRAYLDALTSFGFPALRTDWAAYRHHTDSGIFAEAWAEAGFDGRPDLQRLGTLYRQAFDAAVDGEPITEIPGAGAFLGALGTSCWVPVFATGSLRHGAVHKLSALKAPVDLDLLVTASEFETREAIVRAALEAAQAKHGIPSPARMVSIGDGLWDLKTARTLGLEFIGIANGSKAQTLRDHGATAVHPDLGAGLDMLVSPCPIVSPAAGLTPA